MTQNEKYNIINGLSDLSNYNSNNSKKVIQKLKNKEQNNNIKERNANKKVNNYLSSVPQKLRMKNKNKSTSLTLPQPAQNMLSTITKKIEKIYPNTIDNYNNYNQINYLKNKPLKEIHNKSVFRGGYNRGYMMNLHNIKNNSNFSKNQQKFGKITIYTNNTNYLKNVMNNMNLYYGTTTMKKKII